MKKFLTGRGLVALAVSAGLFVTMPGIATADDDSQSALAYEDMSVAQIEVELARVSAASVEADIEVQKVAEELAKAQAELSQAKADAAAANEAVTSSWEKYEKERETLAIISQSAYREGSGNAQALAPYFATDGLADVARRSKIVSTVSHITDSKLQRVAAMHQVAKATEDQANAVQERLEAAEAEVQSRSEEVQALAEGKQAELAQVQQRRDALITQLADRRGTSVEEERERQDQIEASQRERQEASERARVEREQAHLSQAESARQAEEAAQAAAAQRNDRAEQQALEEAAAQRAREEAEAARKSEAEAKAAEERAREEARRQAAEAERQRQEAAAKAERERQEAAAKAERERQEAAAQAERDRQEAAAQAERERQEAAAQAAAQAASSRGAGAVAFAKARLGTPYLWGGTGAGGYDCSGLAMMSWASQGVTLPRTSSQQYWATKRVAINALQPGDLVFFGTGGSTAAIYHVAIYAGNGQIVEATVPGDVVRLNPMRYRDLIPFGGRP
ncbi:MAG: NlpC/P60 family protein [Actinomycetaceae bacterium]|nr:NlpC/P60 family protein [Actinomycetaceae bacterium]